MAGYDVDWVDAFTNQPFGGNGCAVVHGAAAIPEETRMRFVRETGLTECAFLVPSGPADFGARYYLAHREIPMAGHPTVATIASLVNRGEIDPGAGSTHCTLEVGAGVMEIEVARGEGGTWITMTQAAPEFGAECDPGQIAAIFGLDPGDVEGTPQIVSTGNPFCIAVLGSRGALDRARLDVAALESWQNGLGTGDAGLIEPFLVVREGATEAGDTYARLMLPPPNPPEDPFTGSATGCLGAYLWHHGLIRDRAFVAEQGHGMGRPGQARVEVLGPAEAIEGVRVGGQAVVLMEGRLRLP